MTNAYDGIISATFKNLSIEHAGQMSGYDAYLSACQQMTTYISSLSSTASDEASRGTEYHSFGVSGWAGGEFIAPMLWSIGNLGPFISKMINATTGLFMTSFYEVILASAHLETVYAPNSTSNEIYNRAVGGPLLENVTNLPWSTLSSTIPTVDIAHVAIFHLADRRVCEAVVNAIRPGGLLILANSSNGGEIYSATRFTSFAQEVHDEIHALGSFDSFHLQGYISYTIFIKH
jgi:hypothetical protein